MNYQQIRGWIAQDMTKQQLLDKIDSLEKEDLKKAVNALSYTELMVVKALIEKLKTLPAREGVFTVSDLTGSRGISRSIGVNALRKLELVGLVETRSLGMKGTRVRLLNEKLLDVE